mmetsp:Transcript_8543/g.20277  ORF Transcript_8543/g.20277 Transcript_8543/m.20277 type:complete len:213 (+) Transcript_8543:754-1392(+)
MCHLLDVCHDEEAENLEVAEGVAAPLQDQVCKDGRIHREVVGGGFCCQLSSMVPPRPKAYLRDPVIFTEMESVLAVEASRALVHHVLGLDDVEAVAGLLRRENVILGRAEPLFEGQVADQVQHHVPWQFQSVRNPGDTGQRLPKHLVMQSHPCLLRKVLEHGKVRLNQAILRGGLFGIALPHMGQQISGQVPLCEELSYLGLRLGLGLLHSP